MWLQLCGSFRGFFKGKKIKRLVINVRRLTYNHSRQTLIISVFCVIISPAVLLKILRKHSGNSQYCSASAWRLELRGRIWTEFWGVHSQHHEDKQFYMVKSKGGRAGINMLSLALVRSLIFYIKGFLVFFTWYFLPYFSPIIFNPGKNIMAFACLCLKDNLFHFPTSFLM